MTFIVVMVDIVKMLKCVLNIIMVRKGFFSI